MKLVCFLLCFIVGFVVFGQQTEYVDFERIKADIGFKDINKVSGFVIVEFRIKNACDSVFIDAQNMNFRSVKLKRKDSNYYVEGMDFYNDGNRIVVKNSYKKNENYILIFWYSAEPKKALYFVKSKSDEMNQIWTQGQGKYTSNWLPSIDDMNDKIEFDLSISFDKNYEVVSNGTLENKEIVNDSIIKWHYNMNQSMSSYLVALAIGKYNKKTETSKSGIPLEYYYYPEDSAKVEPTYRYSKQMFDFLENEIGVPYPWEIYKQVPVKDFLYSGMENTSLTIFSDALMTDSIAFVDRNYVNVNAHELAHQWFGDLVTEKSGTHHWLQEGFATYYALLAERDIFGDDYYYWQLYEYANALLAQDKEGKSTSLLNPNASSDTFYKKGCWALHVLRNLVGDVAFKKAIKNYLLKYQYKNVETSDFISEVEQASGQDLSEFVKTWLESDVLPEDAMVKSLNQSPFMQEYFMVDCEVFTSKCNDYLESGISDEAKIKVISQMSNRLKKEDFKNPIKVRQAIALNLAKIPKEFKTEYESFLKDKSYTTIEAALYNLWVNFPEERVKYLQQTKDVFGFSDYNVKLLWLALNLNTLEYQPDKKEVVYNELVSYTSPKFGFEIRQNAFEYLKLMNTFNVYSIQNLIEAIQHQNWRFQQFAKGLLEELKDVEKYRLIIEDLQFKN